VKTVNKLEEMDEKSWPFIERQNKTCLEKFMSNYCQPCILGCCGMVMRRDQLLLLEL